MFAKDKVSQSMIDSVKKILDETKIEEAIEPEPQAPVSNDFEFSLNLIDTNEANIADDSAV